MRLTRRRPVRSLEAPVEIVAPEVSLVLICLDLNFGESVIPAAWVGNSIHHLVQEAAEADKIVLTEASSLWY
jgi:hypothetical protein